MQRHPQRHPQAEVASADRDRKISGPVVQKLTVWTLDLLKYGAGISFLVMKENLQWDLEGERCQRNDALRGQKNMLGAVKKSKFTTYF